jgi:hypothetical protein
LLRSDIAAHCRDTDEFQYHKMESAKFKSIFEMFGSAKLKLYYLLESNIHEAFAAAFQLKQGAVDVILDNISPEDHLKINEGFNLRSFFDPGIQHETNVREEICANLCRETQDQDYPGLPAPFARQLSRGGGFFCQRFFVLGSPQE